MLKIALVHIKVIDSTSPPLGIMYIGRLLESFGHEIKFWDEYKNTKFISEIKKWNPDIIGFSILSSQMGFVAPIIRELKKSLKSFIAVGGIHPTVLPEETLRETNADCAVIGEGEITMKELVDHIEGDSWRSVSGIAFLEDNKITVTPSRPLIEDLDILPFPDYSKLNVERYLIPPGVIRGYFLRATVNLSTSRGCPNKCIYCNCPTIFGTKVRKRSVKNVINEIKWLKEKYSIIEGLWFVDDTFTCSSSWVINFSEAMVSEGLNKLIWSCQTRVTHINPKMLQAMKKAGCVQLEFGIESGSERILRVLKKNTNLFVIRNAVLMAKDARLSVFVTFMLGNPTETEEDMQKSFLLAKELKADGCRFFFTTPFPGTELYDMAIKNGWLSKKYGFNESLSLRQTNPGETTDEPLMICNIPAEKLVKIRAKYQNYFIFRNYSIYLKQFPFILEILFTFIKNTKLLFNGLYYTIRSGRIDTLLEHILLAWRNEKLKYKP